MNESEPFVKRLVVSAVPPRTRWAAEDRRSGRPVWVDEVSRPEETPEYLIHAMLCDAARLHHPGHLDVLDAGLTPESVFLVYPEERSPLLSDLLVDNPSESESDFTALGLTTGKQRLEFLARIADAMAHAHEKGIPHGFFGPDHVLVRQGAQPILTDFGLMHTGSAEDAPEGALIPRGHAAHGATADILALGVLIRRLIEIGEGAFSTLDARDSLGRRGRASVAKVIAASGAESTGGLYFDARSLAADLRACVAGDPLSIDPQPLHRRLPSKALREPILASLLALLIAGLLVAAIVAGATIAKWPIIEHAKEIERTTLASDLASRGFAAFAMGRMSEADQQFAEALKIQPQAPARLGAALVLRATKGPTAAVDFLSRHAPADDAGGGLSVLQSEVEPNATPNLPPALPPKWTVLDLIATAIVHEAPFAGRIQILTAYNSAEVAALLSGPTRLAALFILTRMGAHDPAWSRQLGQTLHDAVPTNQMLLRSAVYHMVDKVEAASLGRRLLERADPERATVIIAAHALLVSTDFGDQALAKEVLLAVGLDLDALPNDTRESLYLQLQIADRDGDFAAAIEHAKARVTFEPANASLNLRLASIYLKAKQPEKALEMAEAALKTTPDARQFRFIRVAALDLMERKEALEEATIVRSEWPNALGPRGILGRRLWAVGQHEAALRALESAIAVEPGVLTTHMEMVTGLLGLNRPVEAEAWLRHSPEPEDRHLPRMSLHRAKAAALLGKPDVAARELANARTDAPENPELQRDRGLLLACEMRRYADAIPDLESAVKAFPTHRDTRFHLGSALYYTKQLERALEVLKPFSENAVPDPLGVARLIDALHAIGKRDAALATVRSALEQHPQDPQLHLRLARALEGGPDFAGAIAGYKYYLKSNENSAQVWCNLGLTYERMGDNTNALHCLRRGHALGMRQKTWPYPSKRWLERCESAAKN